ncbi:MAG: cytoplasmic protein [Desulfobacterales bacterium]|nr:cytoplasmic protein [Desulfobacterales bacterium]
MGLHHHEFIETYEGVGAFGLDRKTDEETLIYYLQKFSDDDCIQLLIQRMSDLEIDQVFNMINQILRNHLTHNEYHNVFLKEM